MYCLDDGTPLVVTASKPQGKSTHEYSNQQTLINPPLTNNPLPPEWQQNQYQPPATNWSNPTPSPYQQGYAQPVYYAHGSQASNASLFLAIASLGMGLISATLGWLCIGVLTGPIAIILGLVAMVKRKMEGKSDLNIITHVIAIIGIVTGAIVPFFYGILFLISFIQELAK